MSETTAAAPPARPASASAMMTAPATDASTPPAPAPVAPHEPAAGSWFDGIADPDLKGYVQNKGWKDAGDVANGYRNLEKLIGTEKVPMPKGDDDKDGWNRAYDAMGRPKLAGDYQLPVPEGGDTSFAAAAGEKFHELGLSTKQARGLGAWWNEQQAASGAATVAAVNQRHEAEMSALKTDWGTAYDENINLGKRAVQEFGIPSDELAMWESAVGPRKMLERLSKFGRGLTEHTFEGGRTTQGFGSNTPEAALSRIAELKNDRDFAAKYIAGGADQKAEMARLHQIAYPA